MRTLRQEYGCDTIALHRQVAVMAGLPPGSRTLDVGTGAGWMAVALGEVGLTVVGLDLEFSMLRRARSQLSELASSKANPFQLVQASGLALPFGASTFDGVFSFDTLHHMPDCPHAVSEMLRVCRPAGVLAIADLNLRGLHAVEEVMARRAEVHFDNGCRVGMVERILQHQPVRYVRHDLEFITAYVIRQDAVSGNEQWRCALPQ